MAHKNTWQIDLKFAVSAHLEVVIRGVKLWNTLSVETRKIGNYNAFRNACTRFFIDNQY